MAQDIDIMTEQSSPLSSSKDNLISKPVHTKDGFFIGRTHNIDKDSLVVKRNALTTIYYHIMRYG
jgi:hypothetical protein